MIEAKDVRIHNWVLLGKKYTQIYQILYDIRNGHSFNHIDYKEEFFEPIPLSSELLVKCGFKINNASEYYKEYENDYFIVVKCDLSVHLAFDVEVYFEIEYEHIKYLHQLQNLIYSLTGIELEINNL